MRMIVRISLLITPVDYFPAFKFFLLFGSEKLSIILLD